MGDPRRHATRAREFVMKPAHARSRDVSQVALAKAETAAAGVDAFDELYRASRDDVYAYAAGLLRDRSAAEDVTAAAFERAYRKWERFDPRRGSPRAWLFGIARNAALDELRRRSRQAALVEEPLALDGTAEQAVELSERRLALTEALATLTARERELVALKFFAGLSNGEIGTILGISESNAGTRLHRVVDKLREACDGAT
jgi:RNA polymerase sigma factor (sigma-70 family)